MNSPKKTAAELAEAFMIFVGFGGSSSCCICAEHDQIWASELRGEPKAEKRLMDLGWFWDDEFDRWSLFV